MMYSKTALLLLISSVSFILAAPVEAEPIDSVTYDPATFDTEMSFTTKLAERADKHLCWGWCQVNISGGPCNWYCPAGIACKPQNNRGVGCGDWKGDMNGSGSQGDGLVLVTSVDDTVQHRV
ncbi:hypothetical protein AG0111_0g13090 [Alternaria gaisen]|uniref:Uncharacterized protein n=1 Tax=Alternaria gaisen TaxID=167740 RepID=A0ACB6F2I4_9PLEO|nr:hypothetical protein AG0111_0g13090 [Alternaria gaisen]